jgi:hypothetical protein
MTVVVQQQQQQLPHVQARTDTGGLKQLPWQASSSQLPGSCQSLKKPLVDVDSRARVLRFLQAQQDSHAIWVEERASSA